MKPGVHVTKDLLKKVLKSIGELPRKDVLVGVPADNAPREDDDGQPINNAELGYIHETGSPTANIPARPHLVPGIEAQEKRIASYFKQAGQAAMDGDAGKQEKCLNAAGLVAVSSVRSIIQEGIPPALADSTLRSRSRRKAGKGVRINKGAGIELAARAAGVAPASGSGSTPLIDTGNYLKSLTYVIREKM